jgi:peptide/nickel transport system ATP-binding protein
VTTGIPLLTVKDLTVEFATRRGKVQAVQSVNVTVAKGETLGIVGESGSGKSVTSYAVMRILDRAGLIAGGSIVFSGVDVAAASQSEVRDLRGREISMIFQNPRAALNPIRKVGKQIEDMLLQHVQAASSDVKAKAIDALRRVRVANPEERYHAYPFELSGGMCQRVVIALALACRPQLLIADEPTTGLDVTTQKAVMDLVVDLTRERGMSTILITHDLGLAAAYCDRIVVMEKGKVVETASSQQIFAAPAHPYTRKLMKATPRLGIALRDLLPGAEHSSPPTSLSSPSRRFRGDGQGEGLSLQAPTRGEPHLPGAQTHAEPASNQEQALPPHAKKGAPDAPLLVVENLVKEYPRSAAKSPLAKLFGRRGKEHPFRAVGGVSFTIGHGESVGLVGESGSGKSTTSMMVMRLIDKTSGNIEFDGEDIGAIPAKQFATQPARKRIQMVFQDPTDSLNPRFTAVRAIADPLIRLGGSKSAGELRARCEDLATQVGLPIELLDRFPHQLSGGQKARVGIARAIALRPQLLVLDEPTAALDVSVQAVVLNLLQDLKVLLGMSYLFVSHDLNVVRLLCDRVIVMRAGEVVEQGFCDDVLGAPKTDYVRELLAAVPHPPA